MSTGVVTYFPRFLGGRATKEYKFVDDAVEADPVSDMEKLARDVELARGDMVDKQGAAMLAETLYERRLQLFREEAEKRGLLCPK